MNKDSKASDNLTENEYCDEELWNTLNNEVGEMTNETTMDKHELIQIILNFDSELKLKSFVKRLEKIKGVNMPKSSLGEQEEISTSELTVREFLNAFSVNNKVKELLSKRIGEFEITSDKKHATNKIYSYDEHLTKIGKTIIRKIEIIPFAQAISLELPTSDVRAIACILRDDPNIRGKLGLSFIEPVREFEETVDYAANQIDVNPGVWEYDYAGEGIKVAVLDSGCDTSHEDFSDGQILEYKDFTGDGLEDTSGHGTHVCGTIVGSGAASNGRFQGIAPKCKLLVGKVLSNKSKNSQIRIIHGIQWAVEKKANIINMSLGAKAPNNGKDILSVTVNKAVIRCGILVCVAAGNTGFDKMTREPVFETIGTPGCATEALTVAAVNFQDIPAYFSSKGPVKVSSVAGNILNIKPDLAAPGVDIAAPMSSTGKEYRSPKSKIKLEIKSTLQDKYTYKSGTSMATPIVSGVCALMWEAYNKTSKINSKVKTKNNKIKNNKIKNNKSKLNTAQKIKQILMDTALEIPSKYPEMEINPEKSIIHGAGRIQALDALNKLIGTDKVTKSQKQNNNDNYDPVIIQNKEKPFDAIAILSSFADSVINHDIPIRKRITLRHIRRYLMDLLSTIAEFGSLPYFYYDDVVQEFIQRKRYIHEAKHLLQYYDELTTK